MIYFGQSLLYVLRTYLVYVAPVDPKEAYAHVQHEFMKIPSGDAII